MLFFLNENDKPCISKPRKVCTRKVQGLPGDVSTIVGKAVDPQGGAGLQELSSQACSLGHFLTS